jgi:hypothetical protein
MFGRNKTVRATNQIFGYDQLILEGVNAGDLIEILTKASRLQDQTRRDCNLLFERQNLILKHLGLKHVPANERTVKEDGKLVSIADERKGLVGEILADYASFYGEGFVGSTISGGGDNSPAPVEKKAKPAAKKRKKYTTRVKCTICGKPYKKGGIKLHMAKKHPNGELLK